MTEILFCGNECVFDGVMIACLSMLKHTEQPLRVHIFTMDLSTENEKYRPFNEKQAAFLEQILKKSNKNSEVILHDVGEVYLAELNQSPNSYSSYTPYCLIRMFADLVPDMPDKILYLDTDVLFNGDVNELYNIDISNVELAGVRDYFGKWFFGFNYLNSGVLLLNLKKIRETGLFRKAVKKCAEKEIFLPDQTAINRCLTSKKILTPRFNEQKKQHENTLIRHFSMTIIWLPYFHTRNIKPWHTDELHSVLNTYCYDDILEKWKQQKEKYNADTGDFINV